MERQRKARAITVIVIVVGVVVVGAMVAQALMNRGDILQWHQQTSLSPPTVVGAEQFELMNDFTTTKPVDPVDFGGHVKKWHRKVRVHKRHRVTNALVTDGSGRLGPIYQRSATVTSLGTNGAPVSWLEATLVRADAHLTWCYRNAKPMRQEVVPCPGSNTDQPQVDWSCDVTNLGSAFQWHCDRDDTEINTGHGYTTNLYARWERFYRRAAFHFHQGPIKEFSLQRGTYVGGTMRGTGDFIPTKAHSI